MGKRHRRRRAEEPSAPSTDYTDADGNTLTLRGALSPATRRRYAETLQGGLDREDAWQRATELLFEHLAVAWTIAGVRTERQQELLARYRMASAAERTFVRDSLRAHLAEHFPDMDAP
ncbi:MAG TPA: hypothetical protein VKV21_06380 [Solirubrobacteraceae bacterium]|nr:hypothetical protein [Solirubrobacteraceae bacterium]